MFINITSYSPWNDHHFSSENKFLTNYLFLWPLKAKSFKLQMTFPIKFGKLIIPFWFTKYHKLKHNVSVLLKVFWREGSRFHPPKRLYIHILCQWHRFKKDGLPSIQLHWLMEAIYFTWILEAQMSISVAPGAT